MGCLIFISRSAFELWGHGKTTEELRRSLLEYPSENMVCSSSSLNKSTKSIYQWAVSCINSSQAPYLQQNSTYKINVYTFNKTLEFKDRIKKIDVSILLYSSYFTFIVYILWLLYFVINNYSFTVTVWNV